MAEKKLKHFYIAEDQSIYLLSSKDAAKLKKWMELCIKQLNRLGYSNVEMIGKGAYGFVFEGEDDNNQHKSLSSRDLICRCMCKIGWKKKRKCKTL